VETAPILDSPPTPSADERWMQRAVQLADLGKYTASPNPNVGCVVVWGEQILGEGWHHRAGEDHAEVRALNCVRNTDLLRESVLYCTLEPCSHWGRTPPCADRIVESGIRRVVIGTLDPDPRVAGRGVERLRAAGISVEVGVLSEACRAVNLDFLSALELGRPRIVLKWAQSADGYMDPPRLPGQSGSIAISGPLARRWVHRWRSECDALLVGRQTIETDDPELTVRHWTGRHPIRLTLDPEGRLKGGKMFGSEAESHRFHRADRVPEVALSGDVPFSGDTIEAVLQWGAAHALRSILVEGGRTTLQGFIDRGLWDEARIISAPLWMNGGLPAPWITGREIEAFDLAPDRVQILRPL